MGSDEEKVKEELHRLAQAFSAGATAESPPLPLSTLVIQVISEASNLIIHYFVSLDFSKKGHCM